MKIYSRLFSDMFDYVLERVLGANFGFACLNLAFVLQFAGSLVPAFNTVIVDIVSAIMFCFLVIILLACVAGAIRGKSYGRHKLPLRDRLPLAKLLGKTVYVIAFYIIYIAWAAMYSASFRLLSHPDPGRGLPPGQREIYIGVMLLLLFICGGIVVFRAAAHLSAKKRERA